MHVIQSGTGTQKESTYERIMFEVRRGEFWNVKVSTGVNWIER